MIRVEVSVPKERSATILKGIVTDLSDYKNDTGEGWLTTTAPLARVYHAILERSWRYEQTGIHVSDGDRRLRYS